jgi:hypothetical protein
MKIRVDEVDGGKYEFDISSDATLDDLTALLRPDAIPPLPEFTFCVDGKYMPKERPFANLPANSRIIAFLTTEPPPRPPPPAGLPPIPPEVWGALDDFVSRANVANLYNPAHNIWQNPARVAEIQPSLATRASRTVIANVLQVRYSLPIRNCEARPASICSAIGIAADDAPGVPDWRAAIEAFSTEERAIFDRLASLCADEETRYVAMADAEGDEEMAVALLESR